MRYFALVYPKVGIGYALDYYPEERDVYERTERKYIVGDFATKKEADAAIIAALKVTK